MQIWRTLYAMNICENPFRSKSITAFEMFTFISEICVSFFCAPRSTSPVPRLRPRPEALFGKRVVLQSSTRVGHVPPSEDRRFVHHWTAVPIDKQSRLVIRPRKGRLIFYFFFWGGLWQGGCVASTPRSRTRTYMRALKIRRRPPAPLQDWPQLWGTPQNLRSCR